MPPQLPGAILPYAGAKRNVKYGELLNRHVRPEGQPATTVLWVLCCGGMGDPFSIDPPVKTEFVVDKYGAVINLARVLSNEAQAKTLYARLKRTIVCDAVRADAISRLKARDVRAMDAKTLSPKEQVDVAYDYFVAAWQGRSGIAGSRSEWSGSSVRWTTTGGSKLARFVGSVEGIPEFHLRMRNMDIIQGDAVEAANKVEDEPHVAVVVDPPYKGRTFAYAVDFAETDPGHVDPLRRKYGDHARLAAALNRFHRAKVCVWYYDVPMLDELYPKKKWDRHHAGITARLKQSNVKGAIAPTSVPEVLLVRRF